MARSFSSAASEYLTRSGAVVSAAPLTLAGWINPTSIASDQALITISDDSTANFFNLRLDATSGQAGFNARAGGAAQEALSSANATANAWNHFCGVAVASDDRTVYLDGRYSGTNAVAVAPAGLNLTQIAVLDNAFNRLDGQAAEVALWNEALTAIEVLQLARGTPPELIRPWALVAYWPLLYNDRDWWGGLYNMTATNTPTWAAHPRVVMDRYENWANRAGDRLPYRDRLAGRLNVVLRPKAALVARRIPRPTAAYNNLAIY